MKGKGGNHIDCSVGIVVDTRKEVSLPVQNDDILDSEPKLNCSVSASLSVPSYEDIPKTGTTREEINLIMRHIKATNTNNTFLKPMSESISLSDCYSVIFAGDQSGFYLIVCPYSHLCDPVESQFHRFHTIRIWIPPNCFVIFNSRLLHGGCKSEYDPKGKLIPDHRIFFYVIPRQFQEGEDEFPDHREVFPPDDAHNCAYLNGRQGHCTVCHNRDISRDEYYTVDPCFQYDNGYSTIKNEFPRSHVIFGDLRRMGFCIATGPNITTPLRKRIYALRDKFKSQHSGLTEQKGRCMVVSPSELSNSLVQQEMKMDGKHLFINFLDQTMIDVHKVIIQFLDDPKMIEERQYAMFYQYYKPNIIFNRGDIPIDQKLHYDYCFEKIVKSEVNEQSEPLSKKVERMKKKRKVTQKKLQNTKKSQTYLNASLKLNIQKNK